MKKKQTKKTPFRAAALLIVSCLSLASCGNSEPTGSGLGNLPMQDNPQGSSPLGDLGDLGGLGSLGGSTGNSTPAPTQETQTPTEAPQAPTQAPAQETQTPTEAPQAPTQAPVQETQTPTEAPQAPTQAPAQETQTPTEAPQEPTQAPQAPTQAPQAPTQAPQAPTQAPQAPTQAPQAPTQPDTLTLEYYTTDYFSGMKPVGWEVICKTIDTSSVGETITGDVQLYFCIYDPEHPGNHIFYAEALSPFFATSSDRSKWAAAINRTYNTNRFSSAPVLNGIVSATSTLQSWNDIYTLLETEGKEMGHEAYMAAHTYTVTQVLQEDTVQDSAGGFQSYVLALCGVGGQAGNYGIYFENYLSPSDLSGTYNSYYNYMIVVDVDHFDAYYDTLVNCFTGITLNN